MRAILPFKIEAASMVRCAYFGQNHGRLDEVERQLASLLNRRNGSMICLCPLLLDARGISNDSLCPMLSKSIESNLKNHCALRAEINLRSVWGSGVGYIKHLGITPSEGSVLVPFNPAVIAGHN